MAVANPSFLAEVARWRANPPVPSLEESRTYCAQLARSHYENFPIVSWFLPRRLHQHFFNVYAFCRWADDLGDESGGSFEALELLAWWKAELHACWRGELRHPVYVALHETIHQFGLTSQPFLDLISAFEQDQTVSQYETFAQLKDYCQRSANPVGRIILRMADADTPENLLWSDSICTGLQLANFWQDVSRDHQIGRNYLPREDRLAHGVSDEMWASRCSTPAFQALIRDEVDRSRRYLIDGQSLIQAVPPWLQLDLDLFVQGGLRILYEIDRIDYRVWEQRPIVTRGAAFRILAGAVCRSLRRWCGR
ncbi:MAG: squalene synthase HpnC [Planctomycetota bacterium]|nr:MAG: squalene synthase HpnC [Planctomycetota bacterium]